MLESGKQRYVNRNRLINNTRWFMGHRRPIAKFRWRHGAAVLFRRSVFEQLGGFDERIFLFFEDVDISARLIKSGGHIWYIHDAVCTHAGASSSGSSSAMTEFRNYHFMLAQSYVSAKHGLIFGLPRRLVSQSLKYVMALVRNDETRKAVARGRLRALFELSKPRRD
ncbi:MAG: glycosyltransferase [Tepidamorphaceae bacterium]